MRHFFYAGREIMGGTEFERISNSEIRTAEIPVWVQHEKVYSDLLQTYRENLWEEEEDVEEEEEEEEEE